MRQDSATVTVLNRTEYLEAQCTACHANNTPQVVADYDVSPHKTRSVSCQDCHSIAPHEACRPETSAPDATATPRAMSPTILSRSGPLSAPVAMIPIRPLPAGCRSLLPISTVSHPWGIRHPTSPPGPPAETATVLLTIMLRSGKIGLHPATALRVISPGPPTISKPGTTVFDAIRRPAMSIT